MQSDFEPARASRSCIRTSALRTETGYAGKHYDKKTSKAMCEELGDAETLERFVLEAGSTVRSAVGDIQSWHTIQIVLS